MWRLRSTGPYYRVVVWNNWQSKLLTLLSVEYPTLWEGPYGKTTPRPVVRTWSPGFTFVHDSRDTFRDGPRTCSVVTTTPLKVKPKKKEDHPDVQEETHKCKDTKEEILFLYLLGKKSFLLRIFYLLYETRILRHSGTVFLTSFVDATLYWVPTRTTLSRLTGPPSSRENLVLRLWESVFLVLPFCLRTSLRKTGSG